MSLDCAAQESESCDLFWLRERFAESLNAGLLAQERDRGKDCCAVLVFSHCQMCGRVFVAQCCGVSLAVCHVSFCACFREFALMCGLRDLHCPNALRGLRKTQQCPLLRHARWSSQANVDGHSAVDAKFTHTEPFQTKLQEDHFHV